MTRARDVANVLTAANVLSTDIESAAAISAHTGITDPHPAYLQESTFSANQIVYKNASNEATGSANLTFSGSDLAVAGTIRSTASAGDEGGEIFLNKSTTNTTLTGGVVLDVNQNRLRIFEEGGSNRGYYLDIASGGTGVGTNLGSSGGMTLLNTTTLSTNSVTITNISGSYNSLKVLILGVTSASAARFRINPNNLTASTNTAYAGFTGGNAQGGANDDGLIFPLDMVTTSSQLNLVLDIESYANTSTWKPIRYAGGISTNSSLVGGGQIKTNSAITSLVFKLDTLAHTFSGGTVYLYGVK